MQKGLAEQLLRDYRGITALDLSNNELQQVPEYLQHLTWLEKLSLSGNSLQRFELAQPLTNLKELTLDSNKIWCVSENITGLQALQTLSLQGNELQQLPPLLHLLEQLPALRSLTLAGNPVAKLASYRSSVLAALTQLTSLDGAYIQAEHGCFQVASADPAGGAAAPAQLAPSCQTPGHLVQQPCSNASSPGHVAETGSDASSPWRVGKSAPAHSQQTLALPLADGVQRNPGHDGLGSESRLPLIQLPDALLEKLGLAEQRCEHLGQQLVEAQQEAQSCQAQLRAAQQHATNLEVQLERMHHVAAAARPPPSLLSIHSPHMQPAQALDAAGVEADSTSSSPRLQLPCSSQQARPQPQPAAPPLSEQPQQQPALLPLSDLESSGRLQELVKENGLMEMRIASLQKIISLQEEQLMRGELCEPGQADAEAPSVAVLARWRQEVFGLLLREAQAEVAAKEQQAQHEAVLAELQRGSQEQIQLLSLQAADVRAELQVERGRGKQAAAGLQEATWQIASLESKLQQSNVSLEALAQHAQRTNAQLIQTATDGKAAMRRLEAYAHRLAFAEERLRYAVKLSAIGEASASGALASSSDSQQQQAASAAAAPGTQAQNTADVRLLSSPAEVLRLEVRRLMADRDLLLQKVEAVRRKQDVVVREAVEATNQQAAADMEERLQAELASHMEKMQSQLRLQHCQLCQELQENEQRCREAVESAQEAARAAQAQLAVAQQAAAQEVAQLQGALAAATAEVAKQATQHATEQAALRSELQQAHSNELHAAVEKVQAEQEALRRGMQEQQSQELSRAVAEAEASRREAQQASTALRQFQRQLGKLKQQNSTDLKAVIQDLEAKLAAKEAAFRSMRQERNALLSVLRKQGNSDPASTTANSPHPDAAIPGAATWSGPDAKTSSDHGRAAATASSAGLPLSGGVEPSQADRAPEQAGACEADSAALGQTSATAVQQSTQASASREACSPPAPLHPQVGSDQHCHPMEKTSAGDQPAPAGLGRPAVHASYPSVAAQRPQSASEWLGRRSAAVNSSAQHAYSVRPSSHHGSSHHGSRPAFEGRVAHSGGHNHRPRPRSHHTPVLQPRTDLRAPLASINSHHMNSGFAAATISDAPEHHAGCVLSEPGDQMYWTETGAQVLDVGHRQASATGGTARTGPQDSANDGLTAPDPTLLQKLADLQELTRELLRD